MKIYFKGTTEAFGALVASLVQQGLTFETKWLTDADGREGQAEIILTGGF